MKNQVEKSIKWKPVKFIKWWYMQDQFHTWIRMMGSQKNGLYKMFSPMSNPTTFSGHANLQNEFAHDFAIFIHMELYIGTLGISLKILASSVKIPGWSPGVGKYVETRRWWWSLAVDHHSNTATRFQRTFPKYYPKCKLICTASRKIWKYWNYWKVWNII